jgi:hypothetical protein
MIIYDFEILKELRYSKYLLSLIHDKDRNMSFTVVTTGKKSLSSLDMYLNSFDPNLLSTVKTVANFSPTEEGWEDALNFVINKSLKDED